MQFDKDRFLKGKNLTDYVDTYTVVDIETTGLNTTENEIIEIGAIKIENGVEIARFQSFIKSKFPISDIISTITGITNAMLEDAPPLNFVLPSFVKFIGSDVILGHNINFDINFIYDSCNKIGIFPINNNYFDTLCLSRNLFGNVLPDHKLKTLSSFFRICDTIEHRSLSDCEVTYKCYEHIKNFNQKPKEIKTSNRLKSKFPNKVRAEHICTENKKFNIFHPIYNKVCVFTGNLEKLSREKAMQVIVDLGGVNGNTITKITNYLILGNNEYYKTIQNGKSTKQKKAEKYILDGQDLQIITESEFYEMVNL